MSDVKWIKLSTHMFEDEKIRLIESMPEADTILIIWVKLLSQAGKVNASGYIFLSENIPYNDEMLAAIFNRPVQSIRMALEVFKRFGMIELDERDFISISNWEKHQNVEGLDKIREQNRIRKQKERESKRLKSAPLLTYEEVSRDSHVTVTPNHATELELELETDKEKGQKTSRHKRVYDEHSDEIILSNYLAERIRKNIPDFKVKNIQTWADDFRKLMELDGKSREEIGRIIKTASEDKFERKICLSAAKIRSRYNEIYMVMTEKDAKKAPPAAKVSKYKEHI